MGLACTENRGPAPLLCDVTHPATTISSQASLFEVWAEGIGARLSGKGYTSLRMSDDGVDGSVNEDRCLHVAFPLWHAALSAKREHGYEGKDHSGDLYAASNVPERRDASLVVERKAQKGRRSTISRRMVRFGG